MIMAMDQIRIPQYLVGVHKIVCMGDSITQMGDPNGYVSMVRDCLKTTFPKDPIQVINAGIGGEKSNDMLARFQRDVIDKKPQLVTLSVGINDVWHGFDSDHPKGGGPGGVDLASYTTYVSEMVAKAEQNRIKIILLSPTIITEDPLDVQNIKLEQYVKAEEEIAHKYHCKFINLQQVFFAELAKAKTILPPENLYLTDDGVHLDLDGNKIMAREVLKAFGVSGKWVNDLKTSFEH